MPSHTILGISGALRSASTNRLLVREAARLFDAASYVEANINLPLYNGDDETASGLPQAVEILIDQIAQADAVVISTPEYNKGPSGVLKNALDWVSRSSKKPWAAKPVALMSASSGRAGGERSQLILRTFMVPFRARVVQGPEMHLANCHNEFDENGHLKSEAYVKTLQSLMTELRAEIR
ncbi:MAG: NADPH-dependent FMN reductase [Aliishimia sp.]